MDIQLNDFPSVVAILERYGEEVIRLYKQSLLQADKKSSGKLTENIKHKVIVTDSGIGVELSLPYYWKYVEEGIKPAGKYNNPSWKAYPFILKWVEEKPATGYGDLPTESKAYLATKKIVEKGIKPTYILKGIVDNMNSKYSPIIMDAVRADIREMHKRLWAELKL